MELQRQLAVGLLDLVVISVAVHGQDIVVTSFCEGENLFGSCLLVRSVLTTTT
jgi:hypothetical protein